LTIYQEVTKESNMADRYVIQIAQDLIRFTNIINDLMDVASYQAREIDERTGEKLQIPEGDSFRDATLDELKQIVQRTTQNVLGYYQMLKKFLDYIDINLVISGLSALGVNAQQLKDELLNMKSVRDHVVNNLSAVTTKAELAQLGTYIENNIPKLILIRRSWCFAGP